MEETGQSRGSCSPSGWRPARALRGSLQAALARFDEVPDDGALEGLRALLEGIEQDMPQARFIAFYPAD